MSIKKIVTIPDEILQTKTEKVSEITPAIKSIIHDLKDTLEVAEEPEGAGLAATQIGSNKRICVVRRFLPSQGSSEKVVYEQYVLINPKITDFSEETEIDYEGCLSVPDAYGKVERAIKIKVKALDENGLPLRLKANDFFARTIQHEVDHLDGILFIDKVQGDTLTENELEQIYQSV